MNIKILSVRVTNWASEIPEIAAVILFGSRATGKEKQDSDWDVCCILNSNGGRWYGDWVEEADSWKESFCKATGLSFNDVQFTTSTSDEVISGLLMGSRVLYVHRPQKI